MSSVAVGGSRLVGVKSGSGWFWVGWCEVGGGGGGLVE